MSGSTSKKIVAYRFDRESVQGFINPLTFLEEGGVEVLTSAGAVAALPYSEIKALCFVRDFEGPPSWKAHRTFPSRPKIEGLWVKLQFRDGDTMEGVIGNNLLLMEDRGLSITPPDAGFQNRIYVPRTALTQVQVLGVVGSPLHRARKPKAEAKDQLKMFE